MRENGLYNLMFLLIFLMWVRFSVDCGVRRFQYF